MKCRLCGSEVSRNTKVCPNCGAFVEMSRNNIPPSQMRRNMSNNYQRHRQTDNQAAKNKNQQTPKGQTAAARMPEPRKRSVALPVAVTVLIIALVALVGVLGFLAFSKTGEDKAYALPRFSRIESSSELDGQQGNDYSASNLLDGNNDTAWAEGVSGDGVGEYVSFSSQEPQVIKGIKIDNGYCKSVGLYNKNNRVKKIKIEFSDGTVVEGDLSGEYGVTDEIVLDEPVICTEVKFEILEVYKGTEYKDTCINEISFY